jgi:hypothetical protein
MAKHYYQIDLVTTQALEEEEILDLEEAILKVHPAMERVFAEYVDSEG